MTNCELMGPSYNTQNKHVLQFYSRLAFCMQNRSFRLYSNTAVVPQKVFDIVILHEVHSIIDSDGGPLSYTIYLETALPNIFGQKSVIENMADCDVKRVTGPYFFRMVADQ